MGKLVGSVLVSMACAVAGCGGDDDTVDAFADAAEDAPACADLDGRPTDDVLELLDEKVCADADGDLVIPVMASYTCRGGGTISWFDEGWGRSGETWHAFDVDEADRTPPDDDVSDCRGS